MTRPLLAHIYQAWPSKALKAHVYYLMMATEERRLLCSKKDDQILSSPEKERPAVAASDYTE